MRVQVGLRAQKIGLPGAAGFYVEMQKLGGAGRSDFLETEGLSGSQRAGFVWQRAVKGYRLPSEDDDGDKGVLKWPVEREQRLEAMKPGEVFEGLDEDILAWLIAAFTLIHELVPEPWLTLTRWAVQVGMDGLPSEALQCLAQHTEPSAELLDNAKDALGEVEATMGETLGNSPDLSAGNSTADESPTSETDTPSQES